MVNRRVLSKEFSKIGESASKMLINGIDVDEEVFSAEAQVCMYICVYVYNCMYVCMYVCI